MKIRNKLYSLLVALLLFTGSAFSEAYWGLNIDADVSSRVDKEVNWEHTLDLNMIFGYQFSEKVAAEIYLTWSTGDYADIPRGATSARQLGFGGRTVTLGTIT